MTERKKKTSRIIDTVNETMRGLHKAGVIDLRRMHEYEALSLPPVPEYSPRKIKLIRARHNLSQAVMAAALNASISTVRQWEIGQKKPSGPAAKLLSVLDRKGLDALA